MDIVNFMSLRPYRCAVRIIKKGAADRRIDNQSHFADTATRILPRTGQESVNVRNPTP